MKKTFILLFIIVSLASGAFYFFKVYKPKTIDAWKMVPANAILAFESNNLIDDWNAIVDKSVWKTLESIPYFHSWESGLIRVDSLSGKDGSLDRLFRNKKFIISIHQTSSKEFDFIFYLDFKDKAGRSVFDKLITGIQSESSLTSQTRTYQGIELIELTNKAKKSSFTYVIYEHVAVGSFTPFLVEDVVRNVSDGFKDTFQAQIASLNGISKLENDEGNIYFDVEKLPELLEIFLNAEEHSKLKDIARFAGDTFLDLKVVDHELLLNGVSAVPIADNNSFIGTFRNQNPGEIKMAKLLPANTALLYHFAFSEFDDWQVQLTKYWSITDNEQFQQALDFDEKYKLNLDWMANEAANAILETSNKEHPDQLAFFGTNDIELAQKEVKQFAEVISRELNDTIYSEAYGGRAILQIPYKEFPSRIMGSYFEGFENSFVTSYGDYLVVGNSMQVVRHFFNELENENNWGKLVRHNNFQESILGESNFSLIINTGYCWQIIVKSMNDRWSAIAEKYAVQLKSFDRVAIQFSNLDKRFYTSMAIGHQEQKRSAPKYNSLKTVQSLYTISPIIRKPKIVKNHNNNNMEVLLQDSLNILYQVSNEGTVNWGDSIQDIIVSDIHQIDYYKNSKLQYLFATRDKIHLLDRNGDYVLGFPIAMKEGVELEYLSVIDYDNSKRYRFMAVDKIGDVYLFDKSGNVLEGWKPKSIGGRLLIPGFHIRVKGGDCMVALRQNGELHVMNRRGNSYPGFPIDLKTTLSEGIFVDIGNDFTSTKLVMVSLEGEVIEVNLKGKVVKREQMYKPTKESMFRLVKDALNKTFIIVREEYNKLSILDRNGTSILEKNIISSGNLDVQYYDFSTGNRLIVVLDPDQEFLYVYGKDNKQISFEPLESSHAIGLLYSSSQKEYKLYKCFRNNFTIESFK